MLVNRFRKWLSPFVAGRSKSPLRRHNRTLLAVEALEARWVPATLQVGPGQMYATIQAAVSAANPGDQVQVNAGTYQGPILINKPITLQGNNSNNTFIVAPTSFGAPTDANPDAIVEVTATSTMLQNFTIEARPAARQTSCTACASTATARSICRSASSRISLIRQIPSWA